GARVDVSPARGLNVAGVAIAAALGDVDRNRRADIIVLASDGSVTAHLAAPDGSFSPVSVSPSGVAAAGIAVVDLNGDAQPEIVLTPANDGDPLRVIVRQGTGRPPTFIPASNVEFPSGAAAA